MPTFYASLSFAPFGENVSLSSSEFAERVEGAQLLLDVTSIEWGPWVSDGSTPTSFWEASIAVEPELPPVGVVAGPLIPGQDGCPFVSVYGLSRKPGADTMWLREVKFGLIPGPYLPEPPESYAERWDELLVEYTADLQYAPGQGLGEDAPPYLWAYDMSADGAGVGVYSSVPGCADEGAGLLAIRVYAVGGIIPPANSDFWTKFRECVEK